MAAKTYKETNNTELSHLNETDNSSTDGSKDSLNCLPHSGASSNSLPTPDSKAMALIQAAYENKVDLMRSLLGQTPSDTFINAKDKHGNTALHLATMLGHKDCIDVLIEKGALVLIKNLSGQTVLNEAISYGSRETIVKLLRQLRKTTSNKLDEHQNEVRKALEGLKDFELSLKWDFHSWIPLVSRFLPADICKIYKRGSKIRMDSTLVDFKEMKWERGNITFLFDSEKLGEKAFLVMDNDLKVYQYIRDRTGELIDADVDILMSSDNETGKLSTRDIEWTKASTGLIFKEDKREMVAGGMADFYQVKGVKVQSTKRREHLTEEDIKRNKIKLEPLSIQKTLSESNTKIEKRESLPPPPKNTVTWTEYINAPPGDHWSISRLIKCKTYSKTFHGTVAMSQDFPVTKEDLITVLEGIESIRHFKKLREFLTVRLPPGFPVKLEIPVFPTVTGRVSFDHFKWNDDLPIEDFIVPRNYSEDPQRFAGL